MPPFINSDSPREIIRVRPYQPDSSPRSPSAGLAQALVGDQYDSPIHGYHGTGIRDRNIYEDNSDDLHQLNEDLLREREDNQSLPSESDGERVAREGEEMEEIEEEFEDAHQFSFNDSTDRRRSQTLSGTKSTSPPPPRAQARRLRSQAESSPVLGSLASAPRSSKRALSSSPSAGRGKRVRTTNSSQHEDAEGDHDAEHEHEGLRNRELRKRTVQQMNPFKFEKHQHSMAKKGKRVTAKKVEKAVQDEIEKKKTPKKRATISTPPASKRNVKASSSKPSRESSRQSGSTLSTLVDGSEPNPAKTTLRVWLDGFRGGSTPTTLKDCADLDQLMDYILKSWEWRFSGRQFSYAIASFPWLTEEANILIRPGLTDSFQQMVLEVENCPVWRKEGDKAQCEVKIMVYLE